MEIITKRKVLATQKRFGDDGSLLQEKIVTVVTVKGNITSGNCQELEDRVSELLYNGLNNIVLNLAEVKMIDSMGISTLINVLKMVKSMQEQAEIKVADISTGVKTRLSFTALKEEDVKLIAPQTERAQKVLKMVHLNDIIKIYDNEDDAIKTF
ncbi:MAG: STAS domain-containing protein [Candidatus Wallbacteria bacterium]|nr:STAS domain-containing protein [Candidatus Wallbacteria bacterium]